MSYEPYSTLKCLKDNNCIYGVAGCELHITSLRSRKSETFEMASKFLFAIAFMGIIYKAQSCVSGGGNTW